MAEDGAVERFDALVVGAGFAGLYMLYRLRQLGLSACVLEAADDIGGTWYWNAYPGARCDVESLQYSYSFSPELDQEWDWTERYAGQPEILRYIYHVADRFDLRRDVRLRHRVVRARFEPAGPHWDVEVDDGSRFVAPYCIMATGSLSAPLPPPFPGVDTFEGDWYMTQAWPHESVQFEGKRVALVGTGSSGIQVVPVVAEQAAHLTVFQRTPNFSIPARNRPLTADEIAERKATYPEYREQARWSPSGLIQPVNYRKSSEMTDDEKTAELTDRWNGGGALSFLASFRDVMFSAETNEFVQDFVRDRIREAVDDPKVADLLCPADHPFGAKRPCVDHGYFEAFNRPNVTLVDIRANPIARIDPRAIVLEDGTEHAVDLIVYAVGYDALSGALLRIDVEGRDGLRLPDVWADGPRTYLGLGIAGFPNLFTVVGPGSPSVLVMMIAAIEQHVDWIAACITHLRRNGLATIEPTAEAQDEWMAEVDQLANLSLYPQATNSYYMGANVPGKPQGFTIYIGGLHRYRRRCDEVASDGYRGFVLAPPA